MSSPLQLRMFASSQEETPSPSASSSIPSSPPASGNLSPTFRLSICLSRTCRVRGITCRMHCWARLPHPSRVQSQSPTWDQVSGPPAFSQPSHVPVWGWGTSVHPLSPWTSGEPPLCARLGGRCSGRSRVHFCADRGFHFREWKCRPHSQSAFNHRGSFLGVLGSGCTILRPCRQPVMGPISPPPSG